MQKVTPEDTILLIKYLIHKGVREIDIVHCLFNHGVEPHKTLLAIELLILTKEVLRAKHGLSLVNKLSHMPKHIIKMAQELGRNRIKRKSRRMRPQV